MFTVDIKQQHNNNNNPHPVLKTKYLVAAASVATCSLCKSFVKMTYFNQKPWVKVNVSHGLITVMEVGVRDSLYLWHSRYTAEPIHLLSLPYPSLIKQRYPFSARLTEFSSHRMVKPGFDLTTFRRFFPYNRASLATRPWRLSTEKLSII